MARLGVPGGPIWAAFLEAGIEPAMAKRLETADRTRRLLGVADYLEALEEGLGRLIRPPARRQRGFPCRRPALLEDHVALADLGDLDQVVGPPVERADHAQRHRGLGRGPGQGQDVVDWLDALEERLDRTICLPRQESKGQKTIYCPRI